MLFSRTEATASLWFSAVKVLADGRVVLGASEFGQGTLVARLTATGQLDTTYGTGGQYTNTNLGRAVAIAPDGRVVIGDGAISRLTGNGQPDTGFGGAQIPAGVTFEAVAVQQDGNIVGGTGTGDSVLFRLLGSNPPAGFVGTMSGTITAGGAAGGAVALLTQGGSSYTNAGTLTTNPGADANVRSTTAENFPGSLIL